MALAAIQALHHVLEEKEAEIEDLKKRLEKLERMLEDSPPERRTGDPARKEEGL